MGIKIAKFRDVANGLQAGQFAVGDHAEVTSLNDLDPTYKQLLDKPFACTMAVMGGDGRPNLTPMWFDYKDDKVLVNVAQHRKKTSWIRRTPKLTILIMNPEYQPEAPKPVLREYSNISNPYENFQPGKPKVFLLALKDGTLRQSVAYWIEEQKLHYVQPDHKQDSLELANLDREATKRFNSERGIDIKLPE